MDAKLVTARAEIEEVLKRLDIAGYFILHNAPGSIEIGTHLTPSYSVVKPIFKEGGGLLGMRVKTAPADFGGDVAKRDRSLAATANLLSSFAEVLHGASFGFAAISAKLDDEIGAEHTPLRSDKGPVQ